LRRTEELFISLMFSGRVQRPDPPLDAAQARDGPCGEAGCRDWRLYLGCVPPHLRTLPLLAIPDRPNTAHDIAVDYYEHGVGESSLPHPSPTAYSSHPDIRGQQM
jgi:hypothetical protein